MKGKLIGVLAVFVLGFLAINMAEANYNEWVFEDVELEGNRLTTDDNRLRELERGQSVEIELDVVGKLLGEALNVTDTIENVRVEVMIRGDSYGDNVDDITSKFDIRLDRVYSKTLNVNIPSRMDRDVFTLTILLTSKDGILAQAAYPVSMASGSSDHKLEIRDVIFAPEGTVEAGKAFLATVKLQNKGSKDEKDVRVRVSIPELGVSASAFVDEVEAEGNRYDVIISEELYMRVPSDAMSGEYNVLVTAEYHGGDEVVQKRYTINVDGVKPADEEPAEEPKIQVSFLESMQMTAGAAGKMYPITIVNPTSEAKTAIITVDGVDAFGTAVVEPSNVVIIAAGETKLVPVYVSANEDTAAGEYAFTVTMRGLAEQDQVIVMKASVEASEVVVVDTGWDNIKRGLEIAFVVLVALLVILGLIIGFGKLRSNDDEEEETSQTYY